MATRTRTRIQPPPPPANINPHRSPARATAAGTPMAMAPALARHPYAACASQSLAATLMNRSRTPATSRRHRRTRTRPPHGPCPPRRTLGGARTRAAIINDSAMIEIAPATAAPCSRLSRSATRPTAGTRTNTRTSPRAVASEPFPLPLMGRELRCRRTRRIDGVCGGQLVRSVPRWGGIDDAHYENNRVCHSSPLVLIARFVC